MDPLRFRLSQMVAVSVLSLAAVRATGADAPAPLSSSPKVSLPDAAVTAACPGTPGTPPRCQKYVCMGGSWELQDLAAGTACNDGNACTYGDKCDGSGRCAATAISCGPCETCNGTATCSKRAAGTACPVASNPPNPCEAVCDGASPYCQPQ